jgi:hypothetical protein
MQVPPAFFLFDLNNHVGKLASSTPVNTNFITEKSPGMLCHFQQAARSSWG